MSEVVWNLCNIVYEGCDEGSFVNNSRKDGIVKEINYLWKLLSNFIQEVIQNKTTKYRLTTEAFIGEQWHTCG